MLPESCRVVRPSFIFLGHNFVVCGWIKILFGTNNRHNKTMCRAQNSGRYLQGHGHSMTLKQIRFRAVILLFMVEFRYCLVFWYVSHAKFRSLPSR